MNLTSVARWPSSSSKLLSIVSVSISIACSAVSSSPTSMQCCVTCSTDGTISAPIAFSCALSSHWIRFPAAASAAILTDAAASLMPRRKMRTSCWKCGRS
eukprot:271322-Hanusia_phi.AAC.1